MTYFVAFVLGAASLFGAFYTGMQYEQSLQRKAQVVVLQQDAKELPKIEAKDNERKLKIVERIKLVKESVPVGDCFNLPLPDAAIVGLRDAGLIEKGR
jgi:hypothetical protein